jgi:hypothetical protein
MIVVCIDIDIYFQNRRSVQLRSRPENQNKELTLNKQYEVIESSNLWGYNIINDLGELQFYNKNRFITLEDFRNDKLDELGI